MVPERSKTDGIEADVGIDDEQVVPITPYLGINLEAELWICRVCAEELGDADANFKKGLLVNERDPAEIHQPLIGEEYKYNYTPDSDWCRILEYYCPNCATQIETEYLPPGHPPVDEIRPDLDWLRENWLHSDEE